MGRVQADQNPQTPQHKEDENPQALQYRSEALPAHQYPQSSVPPAAVYPPQDPAQFSYQPPGSAGAYPSSSQATPPSQPANVQPAVGYPPQSPEKPAQFSYQQPGAAGSYPLPSQANHQAVPFPPNAPQPVSFPPNAPQPVSFPPVEGQVYQHQAVPFPPTADQAPAYKPQPVTYSQGSPYPQQQYGQPITYGAYGAHIGTAPWTTGLFDCMDDPTNTLITACFPCVTFGQVAEILDNGTTSCMTSGIIYGALAWIGVPCILSCSYRSRLRARYDLLEAPASDVIIHFLCEWCALCQEYRELRNRGLDPAIGWQANMMLQAQRQQQPAMTPPLHQTMAAP
ncbi:unnamed protein product [Victoria cruziana]